ncbi:hypothetical protein EVAR_57303_1 [Eumeta japonica]|uniref:Uncharacterized protein n=1 Tax=Eumeta variegata TaxID=151549 RepID=A0A4C1YQU5_EUMVA|nr:hypothetical protein EVAR_57303_1 [Eumeta japonica]
MTHPGQPCEGAFFSRRSDVKIPPPAAASVGRLTKQSGGVDTYLRRAHALRDALGVGRWRGNNRKLSKHLKNN